MGKQWKQCQFLFPLASKSLQIVNAAMKFRHLFLGRKVITNIEVKWSESSSVVSDSLQPHGLCSPRNSPGQNTGVGSLSLSQVSSQPRDRTQVSCIAGRLPTREVHDNPRQHIKKQRHHFADKGTYTQNYSFFISHVQLWELDHKEGWAPKNWCFWTVVLKKTLESPLDCKEIKLVNP